MAKKREENYVDVPTDPTHAGEMQTVPVDALPVMSGEDRMAKARAARKAKGTNGKRSAKAQSAMVWCLFGTHSDETKLELIGEYPNKFQLVKAYRAMKPLCDRMYAGVAVLRGKYFLIDEL